MPPSSLNMTKGIFAFSLIAIGSTLCISESLSTSKLTSFAFASPVRASPALHIEKKQSCHLSGLYLARCSRTTLAANKSEIDSTSREDEPPDELTMSSSPNFEVIDPILILPSLTLVGLALLASMVIYTNLSGPSSGLDVDLYMAIDGTLNGNSVGGGPSQEESIFALPSLSPAEQLVGALFGPLTPQ